MCDLHRYSDPPPAAGFTCTFKSHLLTQMSHLRAKVSISMAHLKIVIPRIWDSGCEKPQRRWRHEILKDLKLLWAVLEQHNTEEQDVKHSRAADMSQEGADEAFVTPADVPLKRAFQPVLRVAHLDPAGVPGDGQVAQRRSQHKVVLPQLRQGDKAQHRPQIRVQEDLVQLAAGEGQALTAVLVQEGEEVEETVVSELSEVHCLRAERRRGPVCWWRQACWSNSNKEPVECIVWPRYMMPPQAHAGGHAHIRLEYAGYFEKTTAGVLPGCLRAICSLSICHDSQQGARTGHTRCLYFHHLISKQTQRLRSTRLQMP